MALYQPLNVQRQEIRFISIIRAPGDDEQIYCKLETASLSTEALEYAALSYVWGDTNVTRKIFVDNVQFDITENLHEILSRFRSNAALLSNDHGTQLPLWVDAIRINQDSTAERNQQVPLMHLIYSSATRVISFLGPNTKEVHPKDWAIATGDVALRNIHAIANAAFKDDAEEINEDSLKRFFTSKRHLSQGPRYQSWNSDDESQSSEDQLQSSDDQPMNPNWFGIMYLFMQPYWYRTWVVQELVLAKFAHTHICICGDYSIPFEDVVKYYKCFEFLRRHSRPEQFGLDPIQWRWMTDFAYPAQLPLIVIFRDRYPGLLNPKAILLLSMTHSATNRKDLVYGFRALCPLEMVVDYAKTVKEVYVGWFNEIIEEAAGVEFPVVYAGLGLYDSQDSDLPSWLPDLSQLIEKKYLTDHRGNAKPDPLDLSHTKSPLPVVKRAHVYMGNLLNLAIGLTCFALIRMISTYISFASLFLPETIAKVTHEVYRLYRPCSTFYSRMSTQRRALQHP
ncbi:heterokaryon incompatibility protein-domain-containing protein [Hypoxylon trugodes]|uniref:heterokaryon incompatibility protein-domain-containing protein n=1 Tax=Hypoxylon trugodes TaxID=326681 RepID=UPI00219044F6|nr:heterokaryon incompatibility protein-domain-containing protein [Hypoxylon trugodes]KAI1390666.1 heterokaryon incompatibility protein-domain-containing protein [Hypoxylon trugodes]